MSKQLREKLIYLVFGILMGMLIATGVTLAGMNDVELTSIRDGFELRRDKMLNSLRARPLKLAEKRPPLGPGRSLYTRHYTYSVTDFVMKACLLNEQLDVANVALRENCAYYIGSQEARNDRDSFYWAADVICRLIEFFGSKGSHTPGRIDAETEDLVYEMMWLYCKDNSRIADAEIEQSKTWHVHESENHHIQRFSTTWHFSKLLKDHPIYSKRKYGDGMTANEHYEAWTTYTKEYLLERAKKGLFVEMANKGYGFMTLKGIYNFYNFAADPVLKRRTGYLLDLYWATWAQEQLNGVRGGAQARIYPGHNSLKRGNDGIGWAAWYYLGEGLAESLRANMFTVVTSSYRLPLVVMDIALDTQGRGVYEITQRRMGLAQAGYYQPPDYRLRTDFGGILRYSYCTPEFIMGTAMFEARPFEDWSMINSQNRWHGVIFAGHDDARIVPQCKAAPQKQTFNQQWSVQRKGTLIVQKLPSQKYSRYTEDMRVWFSCAAITNRIEEVNWVFVEAPGAYAAVRPVTGGFLWDQGEDYAKGHWLRCMDDSTPIIVEVARKARFSSYAAFRSAVLSMPLSFENRKLNFTGLSGDSFTFYADYSQAPEINGMTVNYAPPKVFDSPFIQSQWNSGLVTIQKGRRKLILDFNRDTPL